ncbi:MAG: SlyX protein [Candidatus Azotimanducaceae bacterium]|jgi:SlyX protein
MKDAQARIDELEEKIVYQEDSIQKLDDALANQQRQIMNLEHEFKVVLEHVKKLEPAQSPAASVEDDRPPHY